MLTNKWSTFWSLIKLFYLRGMVALVVSVVVVVVLVVIISSTWYE